jgi:hypothetical protein
VDELLYTPTLVDVAADEDDEAPAGPAAEAEPAGPAGPAHRPAVPSGGQTRDHERSATGVGTRLSAPLRIAEQIRAAYARDARF